MSKATSLFVTLALTLGCASASLGAESLQGGLTAGKKVFSLFGTWTKDGKTEQGHVNLSLGRMIYKELEIGPDAQFIISRNSPLGSDYLSGYGGAHVRVYVPLFPNTAFLPSVGAHGGFGFGDYGSTTRYGGDLAVDYFLVENRSLFFRYIWDNVAGDSSASVPDGSRAEMGVKILF